MYTRSFSRHGTIPPDYAGVALREEAEAARTDDAPAPAPPEARAESAAAPAEAPDCWGEEAAGNAPPGAEEESAPFREAPRFTDTFRPVSEHTGPLIREEPPLPEPTAPPLGGSIDTADMLLVALAALITQGDNPDSELLMLLLLLLLTGK